MDNIDDTLELDIFRNRKARARTRGSRRMSYRRFLFALLSACATSVFAGVNDLSVQPTGYVIDQIAYVDGGFDVVARATLDNSGPAATGVAAQLSGELPGVTVIDGAVTFGAVPTLPDPHVVSTDTFKLRIVPSDPAVTWRQGWSYATAVLRELSWRIGCEGCGNRAPIANPGPDRTVALLQSATLDGSGSNDPDGDALRFTWTIASAPSGSTAVLSNTRAVRPQFAPDVSGDYTFRLVVSDGNTSSAPSTLTLSTRNSRPVANAGPDRSVQVGSTVQLDGGASSDVDGDPLIYEWSFVEVPAASTTWVLERDPVAPLARFVVDKPGRYVAQLSVRDHDRMGTPDTVVISTNNLGPTADAGPDQSVRVGQMVHIGAQASSDPEGDALSFRWTLTKPAGSAAALVNEVDVATSFLVDVPGEYLVQLIVNDGRQAGEPDTVLVSTSNSSPIAVAKPQVATANVGERVQLDGSSSSDPDGDALAFTWSLVAMPLESGATLQDPNTPRASFIPDHAGTYIAQLIVSDGRVDSAPSASRVTVSVTVDRDPPAMPIESLISVRSGQDGQLIVSGSAGAVEAYARVYVSTENDAGTFVDADATGAFSAVINGNSDDIVRVVAEDRAGNLGRRAEISLPDRLNFTIYRPGNRANVAEPVVTLTGELRGPIDAAIVANGIAAALEGNDYERTFSVSVPLQDGMNTVQVVATTLDGLRVQRSIQITRIDSQPFAIVASSAEGTGPLQVSFELKRFDPTVIQRVGVDFNGDGPLDLEDDSSRPGPFEYTYSQPGTYNAYFTIKTTDERLRTYVVPITVHSDTTLVARSLVPWNRFTAALRTNSPQEAVRQMTNECAERYGPLLTALQDSLTGIADSTSAPQLVGIYGDIAEYAVTRTVQGEQSAYLVYMMRGADGVWRLASL